MDTEQPANTFLLFSDVHFDPFADPSLVPSLAASTASGWKTILSASSQTAPSPYGQDTNYALLESSLDSMAAQAGDVDLVVFPGDVLSHGFWNKYPELTGDQSQAGLASFMQKTVEFFVQEVDDRFPEATILVAIGNNDSFNGDYKSSPGDLYRWMSADAMGKAFFNNDADRTAFTIGYATGGYYAIEPDGPTGLKYIVLNDVYWSTKSDQTAAGLLELGWFASQLADSAQDFQKVWVVTHIPAGGNAKSMADDFATKGFDYKGLLQDGFNNAFVALEGYYSNTIAANLVGHTHRDEFRLLSLEPFAEPSTLLSTSLSISPIDNNNPGYEIYTYNDATGTLLDKTTYALDLSQQGSTFALEYDFAATYGHDLTTPSNWAAVANAIVLDPASRSAYSTNYTAGATWDASSSVTSTTFPVYWLADTQVTAAGFNTAAALLTLA